MSLYAPSAECRRLAQYDPSLRFGLAHLPGLGLTFALVKLVEPHAQRDLVFTIDQVPNWQFIQGPDGSRWNTKLGSKMPVLVQWVGQVWGNKAVMNGDYVSALSSRSKPTYVYEQEREKAVRAEGKAIDEHVEESAEEVHDYHKFLARDGTSSDFIYDRAHVLAELKKDYSQEFVKNLEHDKSITFEHKLAEEAGF